MPSNPTYTDGQKTRALELYLEVGATKAGREIGCSRSTVLKWARNAGIKPPVAQTAAATEAQATRNAASRAELSANLLKDAERLRQQLFAPCVVYNFGGRNNTFEEHQLDEPDFQAKEKILKAIGTAVDKHLAIERHDADGGEGLAAVDQWLRTMMGGKP